MRTGLAERPGRALDGDERAWHRRGRLQRPGRRRRKHHLIVAHEVTNIGHDRGQLSGMAGQAMAAMGLQALDVLADGGYFDGEEVLACEGVGVTPYVPKPLTSGSKAKGRFGKQDFVYLADDNVYRCPAGGDPDPALHLARGRHEPLRLLDHQMRRLPAEEPVYERQGAPHQALGA